MSTAGDAGPLADIAGVPHIVLDEDAVDVLELALAGTIGGLPSLSSMAQDTELVVVDAENTPLAHVAPAALGDRAGRAVRPLRPLARGSGPHWDPAIRRSAAEVRAELRNSARAGDVLALVIDDLPTLADMRALSEAIERTGPVAVLFVVPASRRPRPAGAVGWGGVTRAAKAIAADLAARLGLPALPVVVPWPAGRNLADPALLLSDVLAAYGATATVGVREIRDPLETERLAALPAAFEREVRATYPPASAAEVLAARHGTSRDGAFVLFTGLSGSGKSTIARALADELRDDGARVTVLDGDEVRRLLSSDLAFDAASREANIDRIGWVAGLIAEHGGIAVAAPIAPFDASRKRARDRVRPPQAFLLVHVSTPLEVCEARDRKGLYARARRGEIADFTGISSPYEEPDDADVVIDTTGTDVATAVRLVRAALEDRLDNADEPAPPPDDARRDGPSE